MADHAEEQEMEAEALAAIFDTQFSIVQETPPVWSISVYPETGDPDELDDLNNVACKLIATLPETYPESLPDFRVELIKGLSDEHRVSLRAMATEEAEANEGLPCLFAVVERLREWLSENNVKGLDDVSMHAQMMRKQQEVEKKEQKAQAAFESQKQTEDFSQAELEELAVRKRRAEGTPCNRDSFEIWKSKFDQEMAALAAANLENAEEKSMAKKKIVKDEKADRKTGFEHFSDKTNNMEALEAAAEQAELDESAMEDLDDVDEDLFDDDEDLDDLDFEDEEEEYLDI